MKMSSKLNKVAWQIRKAAAKKHSCKVMEISWKHCLILARKVEDKKPEMKFDYIRGIMKTRTGKGTLVAQVGNFRVSGKKAWNIRGEKYFPLPISKIPNRKHDYVFNGKPVWNIG